MPNPKDAVNGLDYLGRLTRQRKLRIITIDDREDRDKITTILLKGMGYTIKSERMPLADYGWDSPLGRVLVERKTPRDAEDIARFARQSRRLIAAGRGKYLPIIIIDHPNHSRDRRWEDFGLDNLCLSIQGHIRVVHCNQGQLAYRLDSIYKWTQKGKHEFS